MDKKKEKITPGNGQNTYVMKNWDATKAKFYGEIMSWCAGFFSLGEDATESEVHDATQKMQGTLDDIKEAAAKAATDAVAAQMKDLNEKIEANTTSINALTASLKEKENEVQTLTTKVGELETSLKDKEAEMTTAAAKHETERKSLAGEISKLKAGKTLETEGELETVATHLGNGGGSSAGVVIENSEMKKWLNKPSKN